MRTGVLYADVQRKRLELLRPFAIFQSESPPAPQLIAEQNPGRIDNNRKASGTRHSNESHSSEKAFVHRHHHARGRRGAGHFVQRFPGLEVAQLPLITIVAACSVLMVYALYDDARASEKRELHADDGTR